MTIADFAGTTQASAGTRPNGVHVLLRLEGFALAMIALVLYARNGGTASLFAMLFLAPDISMLFYLFGARVGAAAYNAAHSTLGPLALAVVSPIALHLDLLPIAFIWLAHIGLDRALGYGLKRASGFSDTHLGSIGRARKTHV